MPMCLFTVYGRDKDKKAVLKELQKMEIMDITARDGYMTSAVRSSTQASEKISQGERALEILDFYAHENNGIFGSLSGKHELSRAEFNKYKEAIPETIAICEEVISEAEAMSEKKNRIAQLRSEIEALEPWLALDADLQGGRTKTTIAKTGVINHTDDIPAQLPLYIERISTTQKETHVFVVYSKTALDECEDCLREMGFKAQNITDKGTPDELIAIKNSQMRQLERENKNSEEKIRNYSIHRREIQFMTDYFRMSAETTKALEKISVDGSVFIITGYVPKSRAESVADRLESGYAVAVEIEPADEDAPVILKNSHLTAPVESVVETFALPDTYEIDPTAVMSVFYYVFFGLMLSDAAYGLIITVVCAVILQKFRKMEHSMQKMLRMFMYCGISTVFWGVMFGSYFGDAIEVVSATFFGKAVRIPPLWFEPVKDPMRMLMFSFLLGLIHLFTGLGINVYLSLKARNYIGALKDGVFWYMLVGGGVIYLFGVDMFVEIAGLRSKLSPPYTTIALVVAIIGAAGILIFSSTSKSPAKRLAKGAYSLYGVTGWLSDVLSYSRLLALGLATGVIATVFNKMGTMLGGGIGGAIVFVIVFVLGHTLNIGVNLLGAYVHTNRLQYVEFFGKFYEGGGRAFEPLGTGTKYFKMKG